MYRYTSLKPYILIGENMNSMSKVNRLPVEKYSCSSCDIELNDDEVRNSWRCPECKDFVRIWAYDPVTDTKITLIRKRADEVEKYDCIHLPGELTGDCYLVLGTSKLREKIGIGLKGYGQYKLLPDQPVNCRTGKG